MNAKQKRFCEEYIIDFNATKAAERAGYSKRSAYEMGHRLISNPSCQDYIKELAQEIKSSKIASAVEVQELLTDIIRGNATEETFIDGTPVQKQVAMRDRLKAMELIGKYQGSFTENVKIQGSSMIKIVDDIPLDDE